MRQSLLTIDQWVEKLSEAKPIGSMTHWKRLEKAFMLEATDLTPVAPELDYWQMVYAGYNFPEIYNDDKKMTDACIKTWGDLRTDAIWMYVDLSHEFDPMISPENRKEHFILRGPKDYVMYKPVATTLEEATHLFQERVWEKYGFGRAGTEPGGFVSHCGQLLEFQRKMKDTVPIIVGSASPSNHAESTVEVQRFLKWMITQPKQKIHDYLKLVLDERLGSLDGYRQFAAEQGCMFFCEWGGARTWGPKELAEFGEYDEIWMEKAKRIFRHTFWHICGQNLPAAIEWCARTAQVCAVQYDMPYRPTGMTQTEFWEWASKKFAGRKCAMNGPTTQQCLHSTPDELRKLVRKYIEITTKHTTAVIMPGCELSAYTPVENVRSLIEPARTVLS